MSCEEWRPAVGYEGRYSVSSLGRVRGESRTITRRNGMPYTHIGKVLAPQLNRQNGYLYVGLHQGKQAGKAVHVLVAAAFVGRCPPNMEVCHNDGVRTNCRASNLRYDTKKANEADKAKHGTQKIATRWKLSVEQVIALRRSAETASQIASRYGVTAAHVRRIRRMPSSAAATR